MFRDKTTGTVLPPTPVKSWKPQQKQSGRKRAAVEVAQSHPRHPLKEHPMRMRFFSRISSEVGSHFETFTNLFVDS